MATNRDQLVLILLNDLWMTQSGLLRSRTPQEARLPNIALRCTNKNAKCLCLHFVGMQDR